MKIKLNAQVLSENNEKIGELKKVVIDPLTNEVSHVVVEKGFWFREDKLVPVDMVEMSGEDKVRIRTTRRELEELPDFKEKQYFLLTDYWSDDQESGAGYSTPYVMYPYMMAGTEIGLPEPPAVMRRSKMNIPDSSVVIEEGVKVIGLEGRQVGKVEKVIWDATSDHITHILISKGWLFNKEKLVPIEWIKQMGDQHISLLVDSRIVEQLPDYPQGIVE